MTGGHSYSYTGCHVVISTRAHVNYVLFLFLLKNTDFFLQHTHNIRITKTCLHCRKRMQKMEQDTSTFTHMQCFIHDSTYSHVTIAQNNRTARCCTRQNTELGMIFVSSPVSKIGIEIQKKKRDNSRRFCESKSLSEKSIFFDTDQYRVASFHSRLFSIIWPHFARTCARGPSRLIASCPLRGVPQGRVEHG